MNVGGNPQVIEYNVRMGDPETEVVIPRIESDLFDLFEGVATQTLHEKSFSINPKIATTVMLVSGGYPEAYENGKEMTGIDSVTKSLVFHAGTKTENGKILTNGGRVMAITSFGETIQDALNDTYESIAHIDFEKMNYRKDIGFDLM
jgi:phosphoribosylamine---glycine ligase